MKSAWRNNAVVVALSCLAFTLSGCEVIGGIFKAGVWVGVIAVFMVAALVVWGIRAAMR